MFCDAQGEATTRFNRATTHRDRIVLHGDHLPTGASDHHRLREIDDRFDRPDGSPMPAELVSIDEYRAVFLATPRLVETLASLDIYFGRPANRFGAEERLTMARTAPLEPYACFPVGRDLGAMGAFSYSESLLAGTEVGRYCSIAMGLEVFLDRHPIEWATTSSILHDFTPWAGYRSFVAAQKRFNDDRMAPMRSERHFEPAPVVGHDVWIGQNVQLARGIRIGTGAVVAAGAVVTRDVAPYAIVGGVPARTIRSRFPDALVERLLASRWWRHGPDLFREADVREPERFVEVAEAWAGRPGFEPRHVRAGDVVRALRARG